MNNKQSRKLLNIFLVLLLLLSPISVYAYEINPTENIQWEIIDSKDNVPVDKTWKVNFNSPLDISTIKEKNIYITDACENIIPMLYTQNFGDDMSIHIIPVKNYNYGRTYTLWIKDLKGTNGQVLKKNTKMEFTTEQYIPNSNEIVVKSAKELLENIGPDRTIVLKAGDYNLLETTISNNKYVEFEEVFDGFQLVINDVNNLTLKGEAEAEVNLLIQPRYANVLNFRNCNNISIANVVAGHYPEGGSCSGGVFAFDNSKDIQIDNCELFGCGTEGLTLYSVENLTFTNSIIKECAYGIMTLHNCKNITFSNSQFYDNGEFNLINLTESTSIEFNKCKIYNNRTTNPYYYPNYLFSIDEYSKAVVKECNIYDNKVDTLVNIKENIDFQDTTFTNNDF